VRGDFRPLVLLQLGLIMVASILLSLAAGLWFDSHFGSSPWGLLVAMLVGTTAGFIGIYRLISGVIDEMSKDKRK